MQEDYLRICAKVDLDAVRENVENMRANLAPGTRMMAVVKTDGYGHGAVPLARELEPLDFLFGFAVATAGEALELRRAGIRKPVLVLGYTFPESYKRLIEEEVRFTVFLPQTLKELAQAARELAAAQKAGERQRQAYIHIKVDTGMNRIGVKPDEEGFRLVRKALDIPEIRVEGIFTHFARADEKDKGPALHQFTIPVRHCANSAGIVEMPQTGMDMVRAGITLYGLWPSDEVRRDLVPLRPVLSLYSHIVHIKEIEAGEEVSYGGTFTAPSKMRIATIPAGYGDGYPRALSGRGYVLIAGKRAKILGRVCMDQFMVDVTDIPEASFGDPVTLIGRDGEEEITMEMLGELSGRFNYEIACCLGKRIPRIYQKGGAILRAQDGCQDF